MELAHFGPNPVYGIGGTSGSPDSALLHLSGAPRADYHVGLFLRQLCDHALNILSERHTVTIYSIHPISDMVGGYQRRTPSDQQLLCHRQRFQYLGNIIGPRGPGKMQQSGVRGTG
eukprot:scaffold11032_cov152-Skeletonema_marinoi.AAC.1